jgi:hypothetical protein
MTCHLSPLQNISENSMSMPHHLMPRHLSPLKNNSANLRKSSHATSPFSIEKIILKKSSSMSHHLSLLKNNSKKYFCKLVSQLQRKKCSLY